MRKETASTLVEKRNPFGDFQELLGVSDIVLGDGEATVTWPTTSAHANRGGWIHGGALTGLLDLVLGASVVTTLAEGEWCATLSLTTDFMRPGKPGAVLTARSRVERRGRLAAFPAGEVVDENGEVLARATGVWAVRT